MENREVTDAFVRVMQQQHKFVEKSMGCVGVHRAQHRVLMTLSKHKVNSQTELAEILEVSPATVAVSLKKLERDGYVTRNARDMDSRFNRIELTEKGREIARYSMEQFTAVNNVCYKGFTEDEKEELCAYLNRIYSNMKEELKKDVRK